MSVFSETEVSQERMKAVFDFPYREIADAVSERALLLEDFPFPAEIDLLLTDSDGIREINALQREQDAVTDVLSFPSLEYEEPGNFSGIDPEEPGICDPESREILLGDIVINVDRVEEQAREYGHSRKREFAFLLTHSLLHLMGYDHMEAEEEAVMIKKQEAILSSLSIGRDEN